MLNEKRWFCKSFFYNAAAHESEAPLAAQKTFINWVNLHQISPENLKIISDSPVLQKITIAYFSEKEIED